jgi:protein-disulfide isomerase
MSKKNTFIIITSVICTFAFLFIVYFLTNQPDKNYAALLTIQKTDYIKWSPEKKHILIEYSDVQCPACQLYHEMLSSFESSKSADFAITKKVSFVYRHFPLYQIHTKAFDTAYAVEAAGKQGKFYEMLDVLFSDQEGIEKTTNITSFLVEKAKKIGLNETQFRTDFESKTVKEIVDTSLSTGENIGINATPTFFLDGKKLEIQSPNDLKQILKEL